VRIIEILASYVPIYEGGNSKSTIDKIEKIKLGISSYGKNIDTSIGVIRIDQNVLFLGKICDSR